MLGRIGTMISDTETERLSGRFCNCRRFAVRFTFKVNHAVFDIRPNLRHISSTGLQKTNAGYNTKNIDFGFLFFL